MEKQRGQHDVKNRVAGKGRGVNRAHPYLERGVVLLVLQGVAALVRRHPDIRSGGALIILRREHQFLVDRVVVVAEESLAFLDHDIVDPCRLQDALRSSRKPPAPGSLSRIRS